MIEREWKIKANHVFATADENAVLSVRLDGAQIKISLDGTCWSNMGALQHPAGVAGHATFECKAPMKWDPDKKEVVTGKG